MRRFCILLLLITSLVGCGGEAAPEPTTVPPSVTPETAVLDATPELENEVGAGSSMAVNTSFADAATLDGPVQAELSPEVNSLFYRFDVPAGGVVTLTLAVEAGSPQPLNLRFYDQQQAAQASLDVPVGQADSLMYVFPQSMQGTMFVSIHGLGTFEFNAQVAAQSDAAAAQDAPAGDFNEALEVVPGSYTGILGDLDDEDLYVFEVPQSGARLNLQTSLQSGDIDVQIFDNDQGYQNNDNVNPAEPIALTRLIEGDVGGRWYVRFRGEGTYTWELELEEQNDAASAGDAPADADTAVRVELGTLSGEVGDNDHQDFYRFDMPDTGGSFELTFAAQDATLQLFNPDGNYEDNGSVLDTEIFEVNRLLTPEDGGFWIARVDGTGVYTLETRFTPQDDAESGTDASADQDQALAIDKDQFTGEVGDKDQTDMYRLSATAGRTVRVSVVEGQGELDVQLFTEKGNYGPSGSTFNDEDAVELLLEEEGLYYIRLQGARLKYTVEILP